MEFIVPVTNSVIEMECLGIILHVHMVTLAVCAIICHTGSQTVEQIKKNLWSFMRLVKINHIILV